MQVFQTVFREDDPWYVRQIVTFCERERRSPSILAMFAVNGREKIARSIDGLDDLPYDDRVRILGRYYDVLRVFASDAKLTELHVIPGSFLGFFLGLLLCSILPWPAGHPLAGSFLTAVVILGAGMIVNSMIHGWLYQTRFGREALVIVRAMLESDERESLPDDLALVEQYDRVAVKTWRLVASLVLASDRRSST